MPVRHGEAMGVHTLSLADDQRVERMGFVIAFLNGLVEGCLEQTRIHVVFLLWTLSRRAMLRRIHLHVIEGRLRAEDRAVQKSTVQNLQI